MLRNFIYLSILFILTACTGLPEDVHPVKGFEIERYLGTWYEIARLDHSFERGLEKISATYTLNPDGSVKVINKGFDIKKKRWRQAEGKAYFVNDKHTGHLKVSFFGPFYGTYAVFELDHDEYSYAFISGYNHSYLWLLARTPEVDKALLDNFIKTSNKLGFDTSQLIINE